MESVDKKRFEGVAIGETWGVADATGFHRTETHAYASPGGYPFSVCRIDGRHVAVFIEMAIPEEVRATLASHQPDWLDATVAATVISDPYADAAVIAGHVLSPDDADLTMCAFATACVAFGQGLFKVIPNTYLILFEERGAVRVSMQFDDDTESWFGEAASAS